MSHWKSHMRNICRIANTNYSNSLVKIMMVGSYKLSFFVCVIRGQIARWFVRGRRPFLLIILAQLNYFVSKIWASKNCRGQFFRCVVRADFFRDHKSGPKNAVNFLGHDGTKKGCNPSPPQERFTFVRCEAMSKVQKRYSLPKSNRNSC